MVRILPCNYNCGYIHFHNMSPISNIVSIPFTSYKSEMQYPLYFILFFKLETTGRTEMKTVKLDLHKKLYWMAALWISIQRRLSWRMFHARSVRRCCINQLFLIVVMVNSNFRIRKNYLTYPTKKYITSFGDINLCWFCDSVLCILFVVLKWGNTQMPCLWKSSPWRFS